MKNYIVTQEDIDLLMQSNKFVYYKIEILNKNLKVLDSLEGNLISDQISIDANSDIRRTYTCELLVMNSSFKIGNNGYIWFNKLIRPYVGLFSLRTQRIVWYPLGTFLFTDTNYSYNATTNQLSLTCVDLMCLLNDSRNGQLKSFGRKIKADTDVRSLVIELLNEAGITNYFIEFNINNQKCPTFKIPYDMDYSIGTTVYTILKDLVDLYGGTQMYFDTDGTFRIDSIPTSKDEQIILNDEIIYPLLIEEQLNSTFTQIYNKIQIWGKVNEPDFYSDNVTSEDNVYKADIVMMKYDEDTYQSVPYSSYEHGDIIALKLKNTNLEDQQINLNNLGNRPIQDDDGNTLPANYLDSNEVYVFRYREETSTSGNWLFLGSYQCYGEAYLTNNENDIGEYAVIDKDSQLVIEEIGEVCKICDGDSFGNIYTNKLAKERARYELFNSLQWNDSLSLSIVAIPWLDINQIIEYTSKLTHEKLLYKINSISCNYSDMSMSVSLVRYYPVYI